jgi:hypothetical protein
VLRFTYVESSREPLVLIWGDRNDMRTLLYLLRKIPLIPPETTLAELGCHAQKGENVILKFCEINGKGMRKIKGTSGTFQWELDRGCTTLFTELVEVLTSSDNAHQYLDCGLGDQITVKVSCSEYPDNFLTKFKQK